MVYFIVKGGAIMWTIMFASVVGLAIIIERILVIRRVYRLNMEAFSKVIYKNILDGNMEGALQICYENSAYPLPSMFAAVLENCSFSRLDLEKMLERMGNRYVKFLEKRLGGLMSIVGISPLLGFLGSVTGLIRAFMAWEKAGSDITVSALASGIYEAMLTTAAGLIVAIPFYLFYNYFISRIKYFAHEVEDYSGQLLEVMIRGQEI